MKTKQFSTTLCNSLSYLSVKIQSHAKANNLCCSLNMHHFNKMQLLQHYMPVEPFGSCHNFESKLFLASSVILFSSYFPNKQFLSRFFLQISNENHKDPRFTVSLLFSKSCELWMIKKAKKLGKNTFFSKPKGLEKFRKKHKNIKPIN